MKLWGGFLVNKYLLFRMSLAIISFQLIRTLPGTYVRSVL